LPTENYVLWAWSSAGFGSALLFWDSNLTRLAETFFKEFGMPLRGIKAMPPSMKADFYFDNTRSYLIFTALFPANGWQFNFLPLLWL